jgi:hypothetical protein
MARKDRIIEEALSYSGCSKEWFNDKGYCGESTAYDDAHSFVHGAEWADETMIDKACHWLERNIRDYVTYDGEIELQELIDDFRKEIVE